MPRTVMQRRLGNLVGRAAWLTVRLGRPCGAESAASSGFVGPGSRSGYEAGLSYEVTLAITAKAAPAGSANQAIRPTPGTSWAGRFTVPPCSATLATTASQSATSKYAPQRVVIPAAAISLSIGTIP